LTRGKTILLDICVFGAINLDINLFVNKFPRIGEEVPIIKVERVPGGKAANVAVASARILGPDKTALIGCLGQDATSKEQIKNLRREGINVSGIKITKEAESGKAFITIDKEGRNVISTLFGANLNLLVDDLKKPEIFNLILESSIVTITDPALETIKRATYLAKKREKIVVWDAGVRSILGIKKVTKILENLDYLVLNQVEIKNLTGKGDIVNSWKCLSKINKNLKLILKLGEKGCSFINSELLIKVGNINLKRMDLNVINTAGCGDAFLGVFVSSLSQGYDDKESLERANLAGAINATRYETRGSPVRSELEKYSKNIQIGKVKKL
jgi:ribokinase